MWEMHPIFYSILLYLKKEKSEKKRNESFLAKCISQPPNRLCPTVWKIVHYSIIYHSLFQREVDRLKKWQGDVSLGLCINHKNSQIRKTTYSAFELFFLHIFYSPNPKTVIKNLVFFVLISLGFFFFSLPTVFNLQSNTILDSHDTVSFLERSKNLNLLFPEEKNNLWNLFRAGARQWGKNLFCNSQRSRTWIEFMLPRDMEFCSYE